MKEKFDDLLDFFIPISFSRAGHSIRKRLFKWNNSSKQNLNGMRIAITGPTSGLGYAAAFEMASYGAELILLARNPEKLTKTAAKLTTKFGDGAVLKTIPLDLSSIRSVNECAKELNKLSHLDCLIHNGGGLHDERLLSQDGIELTLATHVVAPFLLNHKVLPLLSKSEGAKIINMASGGLYSQKLKIDDLQSEQEYSGSKVYARAKRAQLDLADEWVNKLPTNVSMQTVHPGWCATPGLQKSLPKFSKILKPLLRTPLQGIETLVWLASLDNSGSEYAGFKTPQFTHDRRPRPKSYIPRTATSEPDKQLLWEKIVTLSKL